MDYCKLHFVYWIRKKEHTNAYSEGYIGVTHDIKRRWREHKTEAFMNRHPNSFLGNSIKKYKDDLIYEILFVGNEDDCYKYEEFLRPTQNIGWNLRSGGPVGKMSDEGRKRNSERLKGKKLSEKEKEDRRYKKYVKNNGYITKQQYKDIQNIKNRIVPESKAFLEILNLLTGETYINVYEAEKETNVNAFDIFLCCENDDDKFIWIKNLIDQTIETNETL